MDDFWDNSFSRNIDPDSLYEEDIVSYEDATKPGCTRILLMGPPRSGKTSIQRVVFNKLSPHETLFLDPTNQLQVRSINTVQFLPFQIWDFSGYYRLGDGVVYEGRDISDRFMFEHADSLVFVLDAQDEEYEEQLPILVDTIHHAYAINPQLHFEVFLHKAEGGVFMSDDVRRERERDIQTRVSMDVAEVCSDAHLYFSLTSIYEHSIFEAFSKVIQKLVPQLPALQSLLNMLVSTCGVEKVFIFDIVSKLYLATDSSPVFMKMYETCADMIDVVLDISCIYGAPAIQEEQGNSGSNTQQGKNKKSKASTRGKNEEQGEEEQEQEEGEEEASLIHDSESASVIRLNSELVLYLREAGPYLAIVCLMKEESFSRRALIDYNITCFKQALQKAFQLPC